MAPRERSSDEEDAVVPCADCGAPTVASAANSYPFGEQGILCWACAVRRGGRHDAEEDVWTTPPAVADLLGRSGPDE